MPSSQIPAPFAPRLRVVTPALDSHRLPVSAVIRLVEGEHALAQLTVLTPMPADRQPLESAVPSATVWPEQTPVHFTYGSSLADTYAFYGYVTSRQTLATQGGTRIPGLASVPVVYTLTGTSLYMQSALSRSYPSATASATARQVAAANQLAAYVTVHPRVFPAKVQAAQSDFKFLQALAHQVGYRCWIDNSLMYFVDPTFSIAPVGTPPVTARRDMVPGAWDSLRAFTPSAGETDPAGAYLTSHQVSTLRHDSGLTATATTTPTRLLGPQTLSPALTRIACGQLASSHAEAEYVTAAQAANHRYWVHAHATVDGNTALRPGRTVTLAGHGLRATDQGAWRIHGAVHRIELAPLSDAHNTYSTDLHLGRDQEAGLTLRQPLLPAPSPGEMTLTGGRWRAASYGSGS